MAGSVDPVSIDRRKLIVGSASLAIGWGLTDASEADASAGDAEWTPAVVDGRAGKDAVEVTSLDTERSLRVELAPDTIVFADLSPGEDVLVEGDDAADGTVAAKRVIRGVFGNRSDVER